MRKHQYVVPKHCNQQAKHTYNLAYNVHGMAPNVSCLVSHIRERETKKNRSQPFSNNLFATSDCRIFYFWATVACSNLCAGQALVFLCLRSDRVFRLQASG